MFHHRLFAVWALVQASMVSGPTAPEGTEKVVSVRASMGSEPPAPGETEQAVSALEALASALVDFSEVDLERLQAARRQVAPAGLCRPAWPFGDGGDKLRATS